MPDVERINRLVKTRAAVKRAFKLLGEAQLGDLDDRHQREHFLKTISSMETAIRIMDYQIAEKRNKL